MRDNEQQNSQHADDTDAFEAVDLEALVAQMEADTQQGARVDTNEPDTGATTGATDEPEGYPHRGASEVDITRYAIIPHELKAIHQWVVYKLEAGSDGRITKVPYIAMSKYARRANVAKPDTWSTFDKAVNTLTTYKGYEGIGFMLTDDDPYMIIDLDHVTDTEGILEPWVFDMVEQIGSYTEYSPSKTGVHITVRGTMPGKRCRNDAERFEIYGSKRWMSFTGYHLEGANTEIVEAQAAVEAIYHRVFGASKQTEAPAQRVDTGATTGGFPQCGPSTSTMPTATAGHRRPLDDSELLEQAMSSPKNGSEFTALWHGDTSAHSGNHSAADQALVNMLAYWSGRDAAQMDRLFRQSGLMRDKWNQRRGVETYGAITISKAIADTDRCYGDGRQPARAVTSDNSVSTRAARSTAGTSNTPEQPEITDDSHMGLCMRSIMAYVEPNPAVSPLKEAAETFYENHQLLDDYERECLKIQLQQKHVNPEIVLTLISLGEPKEPVPHLTTAQILAMSFEPREELPLFGIPGAFAFIKEVAACLTASPSAGKTELLSRSARYWKCPVLFISEEPVRTWFDRLTKMEQGNLPDNPLLEILPASGRGHSFVMDTIKSAQRGTVVIVDSARDFSGVVTEADGPEWVAAIDPWIRAADKQGVTLIVLHHDKKGAAGNAIDSASGSNALMSRFGQRIHLKASGEDNQYLKVEGIARAGKVNKTYWKWQGGTIVKDDKGSEHHTKSDSVSTLLLAMLDTRSPQTVAGLHSALEAKGKKTTQNNVRKELNNLKTKGLAECTTNGNDKTGEWIKTLQLMEVE